MNLDKFMVSTSSVMNSTSNKERDVLTKNCHNQDGGKEGCNDISSHHDFGYHSAVGIPPNSPYSDVDETVWYRYWCISYALEVIA